ncbi:tetratricopeptide repeat protein [Solidesulfovibrio alcoholivorans]|uniref:tetratricopeptide repeat protein n=1 Tax=Solidesulfovibrio alcoholivorans TaxID=81406 RepID=UPI000A6720F9|nr:tetratricopeptide repeat protein [Solidesulfovibrio alcoholivorans]
MKVGILGTSNSLSPKGWAPVLRAILAPTHQVFNYSAGSNCSAYGLYALSHFHLLSRMDYLILDFTINDKDLYDRNILTFEEIESYYYHLIEQVSQSNVTALALILFWKSELDGNNSPIRDMHLDICNHFGVPSIDMLRVLKNLIPDYDKETMFSDEAHLIPSFSKHIAFAVKDCINKLQKKKSVQQQKNGIHHPYQGVHLSKIDGIKNVVKKGTSFISYDCIHIPKDGISINIGEPCEIDSIFFMSSKHNGYITIESEEASVTKTIALDAGRGFFLRSLRPRCSTKGMINIYPTKREGAIVSHKDRLELPPPRQAFYPADIVGLLIYKGTSKRIRYKTKTSPSENGFAAYKLSLNMFHVAINKGIDNIDLHEILYICSTETKNINFGIACIEKAIQECTNPYYYMQYSKLLILNGDIQKARMALEIAIQIDPSISELHTQLSDVYNDIGDNRSAIQYIQNAIRIDGDNYLYYQRLGNLLLINEEVKEAKSSYERSIMINETKAESHMGLSRVYDKLGKTDLAIKSVQNAIAINEQNVTFYQHLATLLKKNGRFEEAITILQRIILLTS